MRRPDAPPLRQAMLPAPEAMESHASEVVALQRQVEALEAMLATLARSE
jgi:ubiquinone biosynthesis protein UbiJ